MQRIGTLISDDSLQAVAIGAIFLIFVIVPIKISVLLFYKRIFTLNSSNGAPGLQLVLCWPGELLVSWYVLIDLSVHHF